MSKFYAYAISPVDSGWENFKTVDEALTGILSRIEEAITLSLAKDLPISSYAIGEMDLMIRKFNCSRAAAKRIGWEGDMRGDAVVVPVVQDTDADYGFMWKQDNNGDTFVVLPCEDLRLLKECHNHTIFEL